MRKEWRDQRNDIESLDGIIMAAAPYISAKHSNYTHAGYKGVFNILDYTVSVFPRGVVGGRGVGVRRAYEPKTKPPERSVSAISQNKATTH